MKRITIIAAWIALFAAFAHQPLYMAGGQSAPPPWASILFGLMAGITVWLALCATRAVWRAVKVASSKRTQEIARGAYRVARQRTSAKLDQLAELGRNDKDQQ